MKILDDSKISCVVIVVFLAVWAGISAAEPCRCSFQGLGDLTGGEFASQAIAVSADGSVVVGIGYSVSPWEAFRWKDLNGNGRVDANEKLDNHPEFGLGDLEGGDFKSLALGVSGDGSVVVGYGTVIGNADCAFRWEDINGNGEVDDEEKLDKDPNFRLPQYDHSRANDVSADGAWVVGVRWVFPAVAGFRWHNGTNTELSWMAEGVSDDGLVVVGRDNRAANLEAFRWHDDANGVVEEWLGHLPGDVESGAQDVSGDGSVVVGFSQSASGQQAFRWEDLNGNGQVDDDEKLNVHPEFGLGDLPGGELWSVAQGVSADGAIVVGQGTTELGVEAFFWDTTRGMRSLKDVLINDYNLGGTTDVNGWTLKEAAGISADGLTIVGYGTNPDGYAEAWRVTIRVSTCWDAWACAGQPYGDATCDGNIGVVNFADLFALKAHFGKCAPWLPAECCADFTQNGCVNFADLFVLKTNFGSSGYQPSTSNQNCPP